MIRELDYNSEVYRTRAFEYDTTGAKDEIITTEDLINDLKESLAAIPDKYWLSANEIGLPIRAFGVKFDDGIKVFINPMFQEKNEIKLTREFDYETQKEYIIPRFVDSVICYQGEDKKVSALKLVQDGSIVFNQAIDCLDGIHPSYFGLEIIPEFDAATDEERSEVIAEYLNNLNQLEDKLDTDLDNDDEIKDQWTYFKFLKAKAEGKVETMPIKEEPPMNRAQRRMMDRLIRKIKRRKK